MILVTVVTFVAFISVFAFMVHIEYTNYFTYAQVPKFPEIIMRNASHLTVGLVAKGLNSSNMAFLGLNDILVLDGNNGKVYRFIDGQMLKNPLIDLNSFNQDGLIGITTVKNQTGPPYVFLYLNEAPAKYGKDVNDKQEAQRLNGLSATIEKVIGFIDLNS